MKQTSHKIILRSAKVKESSFCSILRMLEIVSLKQHNGVPSPCIWGCSSAGRAPALQAGGQEFDPPHLHQRVKRNEQNHYGRIAQVVRAHA